MMLAINPFYMSINALIGSLINTFVVKFFSQQCLPPDVFCHMFVIKVAASISC